MIRKAEILSFLFVILSLFTGSLRAAKIIYVDDDGPADFNNIQAAIDDANNGDTIIVADGIYTDFHPLGITVYGKSITLRSENGPINCIVDCNATESNLRRGFSFMSGEDSILDGFTIINGIAPWQQFPPSGDFMSVGGAIFCTDSSPTIRNCIISGNSSDGASGGGIYSDHSNLTISNCTFSGNSASNGGGFYSIHSSLTITNCTFTGNSAASGGGGVSTLLGSETFTNCTFSGNSALYSGGGIHNGRSSPTLINCMFIRNSADRSGGGIYNGYDSNPILINCILWDNTASSGSQIYNYLTGSPIVTYSNVQGGWPGLGNINAEPCFADPCNSDYHLKSQAGRWDANSQSWVQDDVTSPCIDAGNPHSPIGLEPFPNGGIVNMGAYGGTKEASKSYFGKPPCQIIIAGDVNGDCLVNFLDFRLMALRWCEDNNP